MAGVETIWKLHTLIVMNSCTHIWPLESSYMLFCCYCYFCFLLFCFLFFFNVVQTKWMIYSENISREKYSISIVEIGYNMNQGAM